MLIPEYVSGFAFYLNKRTGDRQWNISTEPAVPLERVDINIITLLQVICLFPKKIFIRFGALNS